MLRSLIVAMCAAGLFGCAADLRVHAAASLTDALGEIGRAYSTERGRTVAFNFGGSRAVARQIAEGAPGDVFIAADEATMDELARRGGIIEETRRDLLSNALAIVVPREGSEVRRPADLAGAAVGRIAIGDPAVVPAGAYAKAYLEREGLWDRVATKIIPTDNVRAALLAVEGRNADAAIVYRTDTAMSTTLRVVASIPDIDIRYPAAILRSARDRKAAEDFFSYLSSPAARRIFEKHGFIVR
ncbi:MAG: molybdate ABC transporter substrate-binding protein [Thermoanaerobaculia bacterium]